MSRPRRLIGLATALLLVSGGIMAVAGYVAATGDVVTGLLVVTIPAAVVIETAFALIRKADRALDWPRQSGAARLREEGGGLLAGGVMLLAGYVGGAWSWLATVPLVLLGGLIIAATAARGHHPEVKRHLVRTGEKYLANPPTKLGLRLGLPMPLVLLETIGSRSGRPRHTPVMNGRVDDEVWVIAEHGRHAGYVCNLVADPHVRVKIGRRWSEGVAEVLDGDDPAARAEWLASQLGRSRAIERLTMRLFCVEPVTVRVKFSAS